MLKFPAGLLAAVMASIGGFAILNGCTRPDTEVGIGYASADLLGLNQTDTMTLRCRTVREDSLLTDNMSTAVLGRMYHPSFGYHTAGFVSQFRLNAPDIDFGSNPVVDSIYVSLRYTGDTYGALSPQYVQVFELEDSLSLDSAYYSNRQFAYYPEDLADPAFQPIPLNPRQSLFLGNDTVPPEVRVYLHETFGQRLLDAGITVHASNDSWTDYFKGLYIAVDPNGGGEGTVGIDLISGLCNMRLHYHNDLDTLYYDYRITNLSATTNLFTHEWQGEFQALSESFMEEVNSAHLGVFSGAGLKTRISFPHLAAWDDGVGPGRAIHKAELWLPVTDAHNTSSYAIPDQLFILTENAEGQPIATPDQNSIGLNINGAFDAEEQAYRFNISQTMQRMLNGELESDFLHVVSSRAGISLQGVVMEGPAPNPTDTTDLAPHARLVVTWSD